MTRPAVPIAAVLALAACTPGIDRETLPSDPIAFVRTEGKFGIARTEDFLAAIRYGNEEYRDAQELRRTRTSVMLLSVQTGEMRPVPDSAENALPLDWNRDGTRLLIGRPDPQRRSHSLVLWNRLTGAFDRAAMSASAGSASLGDGPILAAAVGAYANEFGERTDPFQIVVNTPAQGMFPLAGTSGGSDPDVSPDGRSVVFVRKGAGPRDSAILLAGLDGVEPRLLARGEAPRYSRDGQWIAYLSRASGNADVWIMRADGSRKRAVTRSVWEELSPAPSPDGRYVVYSSVRASLRGGSPAGAEQGSTSEQESHLYLARVEDGYEIQLTQNSQNGRPVW